MDTPQPFYLRTPSELDSFNSQLLESPALKYSPSERVVYERYSGLKRRSVVHSLLLRLGDYMAQQRVGEVGLVGVTKAEEIRELNASMEQAEVELAF